MIQLREMNNRQHKMFESSLANRRDELKKSFNQHAAESHKAFQQLKQETVGEKKFSMDLLMLLLEIHQDLQHIMEQKPKPEEPEGVSGWMEAVAVETRKVEAAVRQKNIASTKAAPAKRTTRPCTSALAANASKAWGRCWWRAPSRRATPATNPICAATAGGCCDEIVG